MDEAYATTCLLSLEQQNRSGCGFHAPQQQRKMNDWCRSEPFWEVSASKGRNGIGSLIIRRLFGGDELVPFITYQSREAGNQHARVMLLHVGS